MTVITCIEDLRVLAKQRVPRMFYDYADSGSWTESTYRANESDFQKIKLRFDDFAIATRDLTLPGHTLDAREIRRAAGRCLKRVDLTRRLRLLGVRASALARLADLVAPLAAAPPLPVVAREPDPHVRDLPLFDGAS